MTIPCLTGLESSTKFSNQFCQIRINQIISYLFKGGQRSSLADCISAVEDHKGDYRKINLIWSHFMRLSLTF